MRKLTLSFLALSLLVFLATPNIASAENGSLYVEANINVTTANQSPGARHAWVYVYSADGTKQSSGKDKGAYKPGEKISLPAGTYWVGLGTSESKENLFQYVVEEGKVTIVRSGWVSVSTIPMADQPKVDCAPWNATLNAFADSDKTKLIATNANTKPDAFGSLQLHPGEYFVEFNQFTAKVEVKGGEDYRVPTGYHGPSLSPEEYLLARKDDDHKQKGVPVCTDQAIHVLAGSYFVRTLVLRDEGQTRDFVIDALTVAPDGNLGHTSLGADRPKGKVSKNPANGTQIDEAGIKALTNWGKKKGEFDDLEVFK